MFRLDGKTAVITGAGSGIGQAIAEAFAKQGAKVVGIDLQLDALDETKRKLETVGSELLPLACDVSSASSVRDTFAKLDAEVGRIDVLVNNAGIAHVGNVLATDEEAFDRVYAVNVKGVYLCSQAAVERMSKQGGGVICNLASIASLIGVEDRFAYSMSKGAVLTMTKSIAVDYVSQKIRCNCVCPARIHTPFVDGFIKKNYPGKEAEMFDKLSAYQPIGRMGKPEEVAAQVLYLCSDEASFITGAAFQVDGGVLMK